MQRVGNWRWFVVLCGVLVLGIWYWGSAQAARLAAERTVTIKNFAYAPASATVAISDTVRWEQQDSAPHTVTATDNSWNSGALSTGQTYTRTFTQTGTYAYYCAVHPSMKGQIRVVRDLTRPEVSYLPMVQSAIVAPTGPVGPPLRANGTRWSDPATWGGTLPGRGAAVTIPAGVNLILDTSTAALYSLTVDGTLTFAEQNLNLSANWIMVHGKLQIGTEQQPYRSKAVITLTGSNKTEDIMGMGTKFLGTMGAGVIEIHGHRRDTQSWTRLAATAAPGATELTLAEPVTWRVGDEIVVAPSGFDPLEAEKVTITRVAGNVVGVTPALTYRHYGVSQQIAGRTVDTRAEVGLLTRDIVIQGDDPGAPTADFDYYRYQRGFGGHVMIMAGGQARFEGVEFRRMGQTGNKARYPMHWHFTGEGRGQYIKNSSVNGSFHRAIVTHGVSNVLVERNVVYGAVSHAFVPAEDGPETGNQFIGNLGVLNYQLNPVDYSFGPDGRGRGQQEERPGMFWLVNPNNPLVGNVVAGTLRGQGFFYDRGAFGAGFRFADNTAHAVTAAGTGNAEILYPPSTRGFGLMVQEVGSDTAERRKFSGYTAYKNGIAGAWLETELEVLESSVLADHYVGALVFRSVISDTLVVGQTANVTAASYQENFGPAGLLYMTGRGEKRVSLERVSFVSLPATTPAVSFNDDGMQTGSQVTNISFSGVSQRLKFITGEGRAPLYGWFTDTDGTFSGAGGPRDIAPQALDRRSCTAAPSLTGYLCQPLSGSALGLWLKLDETSGTQAADSSPFAAGGTLRGGTSWGGGQIGGGLTLNGTSGYLSVAPQRLQGDWSVAGWVRLSSLTASNQLLGTVAGDGYRLTFEPYSWGTTQYRGVLQVRTTNPNFNIAASTALTANTWTHVAIVRRGTTVTLYQGGAQVGQGETDDMIQFDAFGRNGSSYFGGGLDDLRIYDRALSAAEVQTVMSGGTP